MLLVRRKVYLGGGHKLWNLVNYLQNHPKRYLALLWFLFCECFCSVGKLCCFMFQQRNKKKHQLWAQNEREGSIPDTLQAVPAAHSLTRESGEAARSNRKSSRSLSGWKWGASCERNILIIKFPRQQASQLAHTGYIGPIPCVTVWKDAAVLSTSPRRSCAAVGVRRGAGGRR